MDSLAAGKSFMLGKGTFSVAVLPSLDAKTIMLFPREEEVLRRVFQRHSTALTIKDCNIKSSITTDMVTRITMGAIIATQATEIEQYVVPVTGFLSDADLMAVCMPRALMTMDQIRRVKNAKPLLVTALYDVVHAVCGLWDSGFVSYDMKDFNVMYCPDGKWRLIDVFVERSNLMYSTVTTPYACEEESQYGFHTYAWDQVQTSIALMCVVNMSAERFGYHKPNTSFLNTPPDHPDFRSHVLKYCTFANIGNDYVNDLTDEHQALYKDFVLTCRNRGFADTDAMRGHPFLASVAELAKYYRPEVTTAPPSANSVIPPMSCNASCAHKSFENIVALMTTAGDIKVPRVTETSNLPIVLEKLHQTVKFFAKAVPQTPAWKAVIIHTVLATLCAISNLFEIGKRMSGNELTVICMWPSTAMLTKNAFDRITVQKLLPLKSTTSVFEDTVFLLRFAMRCYVHFRRDVNKAVERGGFLDSDADVPGRDIMETTIRFIKDVIAAAEKHG